MVEKSLNSNAHKDSFCHHFIMQSVVMVVFYESMNDNTAIINEVTA